MQARTTQVMFYLLQDDGVNAEKSPNGETSKDSLSYHACLQAAYFYRQTQKVFIYTENQTAAHHIDEILWAFEPESFVPHNLVGEGSKYGSPVEISWQNPKDRRSVLINLTDTIPSFAQQFTTIIDFVPTDETLKQQARERFRACRQLGFNVDNQPVPQAS